MSLGPLSPEALRARLARIRLLILDVDGVLTAGGIFMDFEGREYKRFNVRDGHGIKLLQRHGIGVAIITGRRSAVVERRAQELGIAPVVQGIQRKGEALDELLATAKAAPEEAAMVGDDIVDLPVMTRTGLALTVADAHPALLERAHWTTAHAGGHGAVREIADRLLQTQGYWDDLLADYLAGP
ncbi:KdsC family phosphatase [Thiohalorhabdus sp.]|uniref:KdsC family phosphatase n=1 Tax=Thiohalorhabdus sp. TaxID=3094134 RepID=UPI002FC3D820